MAISVAAVAVVSSLTAMSATAAEPSSPSGTVKGGAPDAAAPGASAEATDTAKGLIVKTTTSAPSGGLLAATDDALGDRADVAGAERLTAKVATVSFDEAIPATAADQVAAQVEKRADVEWAVPNRRFYAQGAPPVNKNDEYFGRQGNLWSTVSSPWGGYSIKAPALWRKTEGSASTVVAVIDTGILPNHPELAGKLVQGYDFVSGASGVLPRDGGGRDADPADPGDWNTAGQCGAGSPKSNSSWHGTFVAGQIAAVTNNGSGIAAVAPNVKVQPIRVLGSCGGDLSDILAAIDYASKGPAKIVNLSLGGAPMSRRERDRVCQAFTDYAQRGNARGVTFIAAAGNDGAEANLAAPASCAGYISVGATSAKGFSAIYSNVGSSVDLSAPGGDSTVEGSSDRILSLSNYGTQAPGGNGYGYAEGTSMAAPQVAGTAALLYSLGFTTPGQLTNALYATVSPFRAWSRQYSRKRVGLEQYDLNCRAKNRRWCGRGILDLSRVQAPLTPPVISGPLTIGEPLRTSLGTWVRTPSAKFGWRVDGALTSTASVYWPTAADVGKTITSTVSPALPAFARLTNTSVPTAVVPAGPAVNLAVSRTVGYGTSYVATASVDGATGGQVEIRTDAGQVVGTGTVVAGQVSIPVSGRALKPGGYALRAAYLGDASTPRASSPRRALTISKLRSTVTTKLPRTVAKGKRAKVRISVSERPDLFANPTGQVRVYDGKKRLVITNLSSTGRGKKVVRLPKLKKGTHKIRVLYRGNAYIGSDYSTYRKIKVK